jgi:hypothetical protein
MKKKSSFSGIVLILIILFGLSLALNLVQFYFQPLPASCTIQEVCPPIPEEKECPPLVLEDEPAPTVLPANTSTLTYQSSFEGGTLYKTLDGKYNVLDLHGSYREMGRQYGYLLKDELNSMYQDTAADLAQRGLDEQGQVSEAYWLYSNYPERFKEIIRGMSETSGLTLEQQVRLNGAVFTLFGVYYSHDSTPGDPTAGCSGSVFWGEYSADGKLYFGRDWDASQDLMSPYIKYLTLAVYHPEGSGNTVANLEFVGEVYTETAMNDKGIFLELNNAAQSDHSSYPGRVNAVIELLSFMFDYSAMEEFESAFETTLASDSYNIQVADSSSAYSFEWSSTYGVRKRSENVTGLLIAYNSFVPPYPEGWSVSPPLAEDTRRDNLLVLANSPEYKGKMDVEKMKEFLAVRWEDGGALANQTNFQVIAVPEDSILWIHGIGHSDWSEVDLKPLFYE